MAAGCERTPGSSEEARLRAATSTAGVSRKDSVPSSCANRDSTSRRSDSSPPQARSTKAALRLTSCSNAAWYKCSIWRQRSVSTGVPPAHLTPQPALCQLPIPLHCLRRDLQDFGGFRHTQPAEKTHLDHLT